MIPLYEVWSEHGPGCWSANFNSDHSRVKLPLAWAKDYARGLSNKFECRTEVRGHGANYRKVKASFGKQTEHA